MTADLKLSVAAAALRAKCRAALDATDPEPTTLDQVREVVDIVCEGSDTRIVAQLGGYYGPYAASPAAAIAAALHAWRSARLATSGPTPAGVVVDSQQIAARVAHAWGDALPVSRFGYRDGRSVVSATSDEVVEALRTAIDAARAVDRELDVVSGRDAAALPTGSVVIALRDGQPNGLATQKLGDDEWTRSHPDAGLQATAPWLVLLRGGAS